MTTEQAVYALAVTIMRAQQAGALVPNEMDDAVRALFALTQATDHSPTLVAAFRTGLSHSAAYIATGTRPMQGPAIPFGENGP